MFVKKMMIRANLENCSDLLHYFDKIEDINEKYFNEINIYADQVCFILFRATKSKNIFKNMLRLKNKISKDFQPKDLL